MWASANTNNVNIAKCSDRNQRFIPVGASDIASGKTYGSKDTSTSNTSDTLVDDEATGLTPRRPQQSPTSTTDLEMQKLGQGVQVDRTYSVRSD